MFESIIKILGKKFSDLSLVEVASMIEADSALNPEGNEFFSASALDEFLYCADLRGRVDLESIRTEILGNIYIDIPGAKHKKINTEFLIKLAERLRGQISSV